MLISWRLQIICGTFTSLGALGTVTAYHEGDECSKKAPDDGGHDDAQRARCTPPRREQLQFKATIHVWCPNLLITILAGVFVQSKCSRAHNLWTSDKR